MTPLRELCVLVLEDQNVQRRILVGTLNCIGVGDVYEAPDGFLAMHILREITPDIAFVDLQLPGMDGIEFIRHLAAARPRTSVVLTSGLGRRLLSSVGTMAEAYGLELLGVLEKPITRSSIESVICSYNRASVGRVTELPADVFSFDEIHRGVLRGEFEPFFQPKIDVATRAVVGAEALARWRHPSRGLLTPNSFIPVLEKSGKLDFITFAMLESAASVCAAWRAQGLDVTASVNLSLVSLSDTTLADRITHCVRHSGVEPHRMILEVTETSAMTEIAPALENLARLRMRGFGLAVDDYGTGFSSLRQLTRVPFTEIKIDRSFVTGCAANAQSLAIVESSIAMAQRLELRATAEGVESEAEMEILQRLGCDFAQGYLFAKPLSSEAFFEAYAARNEPSDVG